MKKQTSLLEQVKGISIRDYTFELPDEKIAIYPLPERDKSKLLLWKNQQISDNQFFELPELLPSKSILIFNNTKVIRARLQFRKETGAKIEIFCLDPHSPSDYQISFQSKKSCIWNCMVGNQKKWKGEKLKLKVWAENTEIEFCAEQIEYKTDKSIIEFSWDNQDFEFAKIIELAGVLPIPPYLNRETEQSDLERYQTVYSKIKGSVAAPTAGLHFTEKVFTDLAKNGHEIAELTLHVGAGTFQPVKSDTIENHDMHSEQMYINREFINRLINFKGNKVAVGTTSVRTLESLYWLGYQFENDKNIDINSLEVSQWEVYENHEVNLSCGNALENIINLMDKNKTDFISASTQIIIAPGYKFRIIDSMITNFHQPNSTLLLLISAFLGESWRTIYNHALKHNYRFLSYGDSNLYINC